MHALRPLAAALALASTALLVAGCVVLPSIAPVATPSSTSPSSSDAPGAADDASGVDGADAVDAVPGDPGGNTVDDGVGDTWTYTVVGIEQPAQLASGAASAGDEVVAVVLDATHDEGFASWRTCFEVLVVTDLGTFSSYDDASASLVAADDASTQVLDFVAGRVAVAVPEGATPQSIVIRSEYGDDARSFPV